MPYIPAELDGRNRSIKADALLWPRTAPTEAGGRGPRKHLPNQAQEVEVTLGPDCLSAWRAVSRLSPTRPEDPRLPGRITSPNAMDPSRTFCVVTPACSQRRSAQGADTQASTPRSPSDRATTRFHSPGRPPSPASKAGAGGPEPRQAWRSGGGHSPAQSRVDGARAPGTENSILPSPSLGPTLGCGPPAASGAALMGPKGRASVSAPSVQLCYSF